jgi:hypothetical protein
MMMHLRTLDRPLLTSHWPGAQEPGGYEQKPTPVLVQGSARGGRGKRGRRGAGATVTFIMVMGVTRR